MLEGLEHNVFDDLDALIETSTIAAQLADGANPDVIAKRSTFGARGVLFAQREQHTTRRVRANATPWTPDEDNFVRTWLGYLSLDEIGNALGRTGHAVHVRIVKYLRVPMPSKDPRFMTPGVMARMFGVDPSTTINWLNKGLLPFRWMPCARKIRLADRLHVLLFATNPRNWIYFDPHKVQDPYLKRLIELRAARWGDEWWTLGQVARYHGVARTRIESSVWRALLPRDARWGNHKVLRSIATTTKFYIGKNSHPQHIYALAGDAFIILARAVGLSTNAIADLVTSHYGVARAKIQQRILSARPLDPDAIEHRIGALRLKKQLRSICAAHRLRVVIGTHHKDLFADWKHYRARFPALARAMDKFRDALRGTRVRLNVAELRMVRGVFARWAEHFAGNTAILPKVGGVSLHYLYRAYKFLLARGIDPYKEGYMKIQVQTSVTLHPELTLDEARDIITSRDARSRFAAELEAALGAAGVDALAPAQPKSRAKVKLSKSDKQRKGELLACDYCERKDLNGPHGKATHTAKRHPETLAQKKDATGSNGHNVTLPAPERVTA